MRGCHNPERLEAMKAMIAEGCTIRDIAEAFDLTVSGVANHLDYHGVIFRKTHKKAGPRSPERLEIMRKLYEEDRFSMRLIGLRFGLSEEAVFCYFKRHGVPRRKLGSPKGVTMKEHQRRFRRAMAGVLGE